jgi:hypothetical protein
MKILSPINEHVEIFYNVVVVFVPYFSKLLTRFKNKIMLQLALGIDLKNVNYLNHILYNVMHMNYLHNLVPNQPTYHNLWSNQIK